MVEYRKCNESHISYSWPNLNFLLDVFFLAWCTWQLGEEFTISVHFSSARSAKQREITTLFTLERWSNLWPWDPSCSRYWGQNRSREAILSHKDAIRLSISRFVSGDWVSQRTTLSFTTLLLYNKKNPLFKHWILNPFHRKIHGNKYIMKQFA